MPNKAEVFNDYRRRMNERILSEDHAAIKRFFGVDTLAYQSGALDAKTKELILFSLVVHSRCHPCFDAHYQKARELGIAQAELDEAAWCAIAMGGAPVKMFYQECLRRVTSAH